MRTLDALQPLFINLKEKVFDTAQDIKDSLFIPISKLTKQEPTMQFPVERPEIERITKGFTPVGKEPQMSFQQAASIFPKYVSQQIQEKQGQVPTTKISPELAKEAGENLGVSAMGYTEPLKQVKTPQVFKGSKDLTTKFLDYTKGKTTLSKQEIMDFAKRPELKKGEADLLLRKLEEFEPKVDLEKEFFTSEPREASKEWLAQWIGGAYGGEQKNPPREIIEIFNNPKYKPDKPITVYKAVDKEITKQDLLEEMKDKFSSWTTSKSKANFFGKEEIGDFRIEERVVNPDEVFIEINKLPRSLKQYAFDISSIGGEEKEIILKSLSSKQSSKLPAQEFADSIRRDLLKLETRDAGKQYINTNIDNRVDEISTETAGKNYEEVVFESPITTNGSSHYPNSKNYFAHARGDEVVESGKKIWREQEIQSDLLQKDNLDLALRTPRVGTLYGTTIGGKKLNKELISESKDKLIPFTNDRFGERIMRERIKEKAQKGYSSYRLPTGETIGKIEGFENVTWFDITRKNLLKETDLKVGSEVRQGDSALAPRWTITDILGDGRFKAMPKQHFDSFAESKGLNISGKDLVIYAEHHATENFWGSKETFDLTGKSNPQYRRYEQWGKFLKNKYGGKEVTDPQGNSWMEIDLKPEYKRMPIEAFGAGALMLGEQDEEEKPRMFKSQVER